MKRTVAEEIRVELEHRRQTWSDVLGEDFYLPEDKKQDLFASLYAGHHLLIVGPTGCGKTDLAQRIGRLLGDIEVVAGCPLHCPPEDPSCPWCLTGEALNKARLMSADRLVRVQGSAELAAEDLIGGLSPEMAFKHGLHDVRAFSPGKLFQANRSILLIDFLDRIAPRTLNALLPLLEGEKTQLTGTDVEIPVDTLVIGTSSRRGLSHLSRDFVDHFDAVELVYIEKQEAESKIIFNGENRSISDESAGQIMEVISGTRTHPDLSRGVSTRGGQRLAETVHVGETTFGKTSPEVIRGATGVCLPHRVEVAAHAESYRSSRSIVEDVVDFVLRGTKKGDDTGMTDDLLAQLVEEIVRVDDIRKPLKFGFFDILLKRLERLPDLSISKVYQDIFRQKEEALLEDLKKSDMTDDLLAEIEASRLHRASLLEEYRKEAQKQALEETLELLEENQVIVADSGGWRISGKGILMLLDRLNPRNPDGRQMSAHGYHRTGRRTFLGEGKTVGFRKYRLGDRYRDVSFRYTIREAIKKGKKSVEREDIRIWQRERRSTMDIVLVVDLSGTMLQMEKLWYAKESSIALAMASSRYRDRVGVVTFSNLSQVAVPITRSPYKLADILLNMELHENAFTNIGVGIKMACHLMESQGRRHATRHIILISDGDANVPKPSPERYALSQAARTIKKGITISCVCLNEKSANPEFMKRISNIGKGRTYSVGGEEMRDAVLADRETRVR